MSEGMMNMLYLMLMPAGRAVELFLQQLCDKSSEIAMERKAKTITASHL